MSDVKTLLSGIVLGESPRWHDGRLWFCDWVAGQVCAVGLDGNREIALNLKGFPFSIDWLSDGTLFVVSTGETAIMRNGSDGRLAVHADLSGISRYPWNEIVVDGRDNAYVNSIGFDMMGGAPPSTGIIACVTADGVARQVADGIEFPNGMAITPDNSTLIIAESYGNRLTAFDISNEGDLSRRRVWADLGEGVPDGICIDTDGAIWYGDVPNKRCVRVREGGEVLQTVQLDRGCFACMLGGNNGRTLFMLGAEWSGPSKVNGPPTGHVYCLDVAIPHAGRP